MDTSSQSLFPEFGPNSGYVRELYELYQANSSFVSDSWAQFFRAYDGSKGIPMNGNGHHAAAAHAFEASPSPAMLDLQRRVFQAIEAYRARGHLKAKVNPLSRGIVRPPVSSDLDWGYYRIANGESTASVYCDGIAGKQTASPSEIFEALERTYCGSVGYELSHISSTEERLFLRSKIEARAISNEKRDGETLSRWLQKLVDAEAFEAELHRRYVGQKRFSLQGGDTAIPMLDALVEKAGASGVKEVIFGMSHRGRLNVLTNTLGKPMNIIFSEFEDRSLAAAVGSGDVKYHLGYSSEHTARSGETMRLSLAPNPSHLEFVNAVVEGMARARQDLENGAARTAVLPVLLHGEAAFVGQGIVWETLNLSRVSGYATGGTVHLVINNQVGFTTTPDEARSSIYATDIAKAVDAPIFHVNCEDVESACWVMEVALEFRQMFARDVVVDLVCYRKYGHNEGDDPSFTQPLIYAEIAEKEPASSIFGRKLQQAGVISEGELDACFARFKERFQKAAENVPTGALGAACSMHGRLRVPTPPTGVAKDTLAKIVRSYVEYPESFVPHPKLQKILEKRVEAFEEGQGIDWGTAESMAFGSLLLDGHGVRLSGQDCGRGTFSHRHAVLDHHEAQETYVPLERFADPSRNVKFEVHNSTLSEAAVMGFEFGYSALAPRSLVLWEAQFGDFANGAQVIIDQFISSSEAKWSFLSGVVLLLPHGYEGQGPEHSSARLERFLQLCAEGNMVVAYPTTAAQYFHLLRRQGISELKRPLIVMTPKSLLRSAGASSEVAALTAGQFEPVLETNLSEGKAKHLLLCAGKVYYDIKAALEKLGKPSVSVIRVEELYPFPQLELERIAEHHEPKSAIWVQEEPRNMGSWTYIEPYLRDTLGLQPRYIGRPASASTAAGSTKRHTAEQQSILSEILEAVE